MRPQLLLIAFLALALGFAATPPPAVPDPLLDPLPDLATGPHVLRLTDIASTLVFPTDVAAPDDGSGRLFVTQAGGQLRVLVDDVLLAQPFLDFSADFYPSNGSAMSSVAAHPQFATNRKLYVTMTENEDPALADFGPSSGVSLQSVLYEVVAQADWPAPGCNLVDPAATRELLRINELNTIHNLDDLSFGPDGYLYASKGDDLNGGQNLTTIFGTVLRLDVDLAPGNTPSANGTYAIPASNPFVGAGGGVLEEIYAYGFRNPWRIHHDADELWVADVGEGFIEEISRVVPGGNHGWSVKEGPFAHLPGVGVSDDLSELPPGVFIDPVGAYDHGQSDRSLSGGAVYRGAALPELVGDYLCGDWISGRLFRMDTSTGALERLGVDPGGATITGQLGELPREGVIAVATDADGELLLVVTQRNGTPTGRLVRVAPGHWEELGGGLAGTAGEPELIGTGSMLPGAPTRLSLTQAAPQAPAALVLGASQLGAPFKGGLMVPSLDALFAALSTDALGQLTLNAAWPTNVPSGTTTYAQVWITDAAGPVGFAASNAVRWTAP